jgi:hypothetical protein
MKRLFTILAAVFLTVSLFLPKPAGAQAPGKISYQALIRDTDDDLVTDTHVGMQISILQGSASGTAVYTETQTPPVNANGLVSLEIGAGTIVSGDFATIDWTNGPYFVNTKTDPTGGAAYSISGTRQLLSVPYALHAETAKMPEGGIIETDPVYGASAASGITATDIDNWNNKQELLTAGAGIEISGNAISATNNVTTYSVGDFAHGGIVFWVDETGQHGLVCAKEDQSSMRWYAGTYGDTQAKGDGPFAGKANTSIIIAAQVAIGDDGNTYAARICNELQITEEGKTYGDWYLPSIEELNLMYLNKSIIDAAAIANGGSAFIFNIYWSSTEFDNFNACFQDFISGKQDEFLKNTATYSVRAVRAF